MLSRVVKSGCPTSPSQAVAGPVGPDVRPQRPTAVSGRFHTHRRAAAPDHIGVAVGRRMKPERRFIVPVVRSISPCTPYARRPAAWETMYHHTS
jgi:hypothetical protein